MNSITNEALYDGTSQIVIDVRSPGEYEAYHINGAINMPLFTNEERHNIGVAYKQESITKAKKLGMEYMSYKLQSLSSEMIDYSEKYDRVIIYCERGGMRSRSIATLLNAVDIKNVHRLDGGIKAHRQYTMDNMQSVLDQKKFIVLHGHTGVGKTKILVELDKLEHDVLDYEALAQNAGSVFGDLMYPKPAPTQKHFEELLFDVIKRSKTDLIFIESESKRVGKVIIPDMFMSKLTEGIHILVQTTVENRIENLLSDYKDRNDEELIRCVNILRKRISNSVADELIEHINHGNLNALVKYLLIDYYDPFYDYSIDKYQYELKINYGTIDEAVTDICTAYKKGF